jgi:IS30 family transposase
VLLAKMDDATAESALKAFSAKLDAIAAPLRQTLTYDQGREMAAHQALTERTGVKVYFCDPHSPWQRGTCENTNGLLRQYLPKGTDLPVHSQDDLDAIADQMNSPGRVLPMTDSLRWRSMARYWSLTLIAPPQSFHDAGRCCSSVLRPPRI